MGMEVEHGQICLVGRYLVGQNTCPKRESLRCGLGSGLKRYLEFWPCLRLWLVSFVREALCYELDDFFLDGFAKHVARDGGGQNNVPGLFGSQDCGCVIEQLLFGCVRIFFQCNQRNGNVLMNDMSCWHGQDI